MAAYYGSDAYAVRTPPTTVLRSLSGLTFALTVAAAAVVGALVVQVGIFVQFWLLLSDFEAGTIDVDEYLASLDASEQWMNWATPVTLGLQAIFGILFVIWLYRARSNAELLCATPHRMSRGWVFAGFLPIANWFVPPIVLDDVQRASDPRTAPNSVRLPANSTTPIVVLWWASWFVGLLLWFIGLLTSISVRYGWSDDSGRAAISVALFAGAVIAAAVSAFAVRTVLSRVTEWQRGREVPDIPAPQPYPGAPGQFGGVVHREPVAVGRYLGPAASFLLFPVLLGPVVIASAMSKYDYLDSLSEDSAEYDAALSDWAIPTMLGFAALLITVPIAAVTLICWQLRANRNAETLSPGGPRLGRSWVVAGWIVPLANLFLPVVAIHQLTRPGGSGVATALAGAWWVTWIGGWIAFWVGFSIGSAPAFWVSCGLLFLAAVLLSVLVNGIDRAQRVA
ncbi:DUF4328 domain-containing protein [Nocardia crassostreae]|uniref:DUF4328 domain-containing protein n=1 Tax=Nocardia crassostreae TaxID=53428 RepID=UPI00082C850A|nr:DUF4328 domain-containing protein [Nocardia crassostreae]